MVSKALLALVIAMSSVPGTAAGQRAGAPDTSRRAANPAVWRIDKSHSELSFQIRHFLGRVRGTFREWGGTITVDDPARWERASVDVAIQAASIFTDHERRDADLRTGEFFAADSFPVIAFKSTRVERRGDEAKIHGDLTLRGVTRPVVLDGRFLGLNRFPDGTERVAFEATTTINRLDWGVTWNRFVEGAGLTLGDDVKIEMTIQASRRPTA